MQHRYNWDTQVENRDGKNSSYLFMYRRWYINAVKIHLPTLVTILPKQKTQQTDFWLP